MGRRLGRRPDEGSAARTGAANVSGLLVPIWNQAGRLPSVRQDGGAGSSGCAYSHSRRNLPPAVDRFFSPPPASVLPISYTSISCGFCVERSMVKAIRRMFSRSAPSRAPATTKPRAKDARVRRISAPAARVAILRNRRQDDASWPHDVRPSPYLACKGALLAPSQNDQLP